MSIYRKNPFGAYHRTEETMTFRILEIPRIVRKQGKVYMNFNNLRRFHQMGDAATGYEKVFCTNPYNSRDVYCATCASFTSMGRQMNFQREYLVPVQIKEGWNGVGPVTAGTPSERDGEGNFIVTPLDEYYEGDTAVEYELAIRPSVVNEIKDVYIEAFENKIPEKDFRHIWWTVKRTRSAPWAEVIEYELDRDTPFPHIRMGEVEDLEEEETPTKAGGLRLSATKGVLPQNMFSIESLTPKERDGIITAAQTFKDALTDAGEGAVLSASQVRDHLLISGVIGGSSDKEKRDKVDWVMQNCFDVGWNLIVEL